MLKIGLTGGLACGKSTVAAMLVEIAGRAGAPAPLEVVNADRMGHEAIAPGGPAYDAVVAEFGVLAPDGQVDRVRLGALVFGDAERLRRLNEIVHPHILQAIERRAADFARRRRGGLLVVEAALLLEAFAESRVDQVVVVDCSVEQQIERYVSKAGAGDEESARRRIASQMPRAERLRRADFVIDASQSLEATRRQVEELYARLATMTATMTPRLGRDAGDQRTP